MKLAEIYLMFK